MDWNPWHGCTKISEGCRNCYMYRADQRHDRTPNVVCKTQSFDLPIRKKRDGSYKLQTKSGVIATCFTSDFFHPDADEWRVQAWQFIKERQDATFLFITKRPDRFFVSLPDDWGDGYENVYMGCTCENQEMADKRLPIFLKLPLRQRFLVCEPLLSALDLSAYLPGSGINELICGGESGEYARVCDYNWILSLREQCLAANISFTFKQTGARLLKDGKLYFIKRPLQHSQARKANINFKSRP